MMTLRENETPMKYALFLGKEPIMQDYEDEEGNKYPVGESGQYRDTYSSPAEISANINMSGGDAESREYGLSVDQYEAVLVYDKGAYPLKEGSPIWVKSPIIYRYGSPEEKEVEIEVREVDENGVVKRERRKVMTNMPQVESADYTVIKLADSISFTKAILKAVNK